jgi:cell wall-associated NlpC family hydrolase
VNCRSTGRRVPRAAFGRGMMVATILVLVGVSTPGLVGIAAPGAGATGTSSSTTLPGPAPNQSQINSTQSQVSQVEATLTQEEQQSSLLDNRYDTAVQSLQNAQDALQKINATLTTTRAAVQVDKHHLSNDAVKAYIYATPQTQFASLFLHFSHSRRRTKPVHRRDRRQSGSRPRHSPNHREPPAEPGVTTAEHREPGAVGSQPGQVSRAANEQEATATKATLSQVQGQLAQEVAQAEVKRHRKKRRRRRRPPARRPSKAAAAAAAAAAVAGGGRGFVQWRRGDRCGRPGCGHHSSTGDSGSSTDSGSVGGTGVGDSGRWPPCRQPFPSWAPPMSSEGETPGVGFDCSGLVQWAWGQAGVSIPRTTETQWPDLTHVSLERPRAR